MNITVPLRFEGQYNRYIYNVPSPNLYSTQLTRQRSFATRAMYEYEYTKLRNGVSYFVTFTFNDNSVIKLRGSNYCNNSSFRSFLVNKLYKTIERKYNCKVKYFCCGELGEGKGKRGYANNPHFHVIFYLTPTSQDSILPSEQTFFRLIRDYWESEDVTCNPRYYNYGIVSGSKRGTSALTSSDACGYVAKYVTKDKFHYQKLDELRNSVFRILFRFWQNMDKLDMYDFQQCDYDYLLIFHRFGKIQIDSTDSIYKYLLSLFLLFFNLNHSTFSHEINQLYELRDIATNYLKKYLLPKPFLSNGLGLYAMSQVRDWSRPCLPYKTGHGIQYFPIPQYIYRKKFFDVERYQLYNAKYDVIEYRTRYVPNEEHKKLFGNYEFFRTMFNRSFTKFVENFRINQNLSLDSIIEFLYSHKLIPKKPTYLPPQALTSISLSTLFFYYIYKNYYEGTTFTPSFIHINEPSNLEIILDHLHNDYINLKYESKIITSTDSTYLSPIPESFPSDRYFAKYFPSFQIIDYLLTYLSYFINEELVQKNDEWRQIRRNHFVHSD
ncbi:replication initiator protein [Dipodfec virus UA06Rod_12]|uniref:Replication initiator protein n=1 Tax=Dipodfec virus UA06Rod_12 TaxID=2929316 RepID=A0A976N1Z9_9VIRU|nr:replication initiator protein [Dipodfec virus UA06Rod_12]